MDVQHLTVPPAEAEKMLRKYREHRHYDNPLDEEIMRIYSMVAKGKTIINARQSIIAAGLQTSSSLPKLAIARADGKKLVLEVNHYNGAKMITDAPDWYQSRIASSRLMAFAKDDFSGLKAGRYSAMVPHIPPDIRPNRGLPNYHILFEAVWKPEPPIDPYLMRRLGKSDFFIVLAAWDLSDIERAVMAAHMPRNRQ